MKKESSLMSYPGKILQNPRVFAHRGASEEFPQNTILAFDMAIQQGAAGIETDLQYTKDHQIVCFHDRSLDRLSTIKGNVHNTTFKMIAKARIKHKKFISESIPTLIELLEWLPKETALMLELKDPSFQNPELMYSFIDVLSKYNVIGKTILSSFFMANLEQAKKVSSSILTCFITPINFSPNINSDILAPFYPILWINPAYSIKAHRANKFVSVWDPHPEIRIKEYLRQKIDIITGDSPIKILNAISRSLPE